MLSCKQCSQYLQSTDDICATSCGHLHHSKCLGSWRTHFWSCPLCRAFPYGTQKIFLSFNNQAEPDAVKARLKEKDAQIAAQKTDLARTQNNCAQLEKKLENFSSRYKSIENYNLGLHGKNTALQEQLDEMKKNVKALTLKQKDEEITALKKYLEQSHNKYTELQQKVEYFKEQYEEIMRLVLNIGLQKELAATKICLEETQNKCTELEAKYENIEKDHVKKIVENSDLREQLTKMEKNMKAPLKKRDAEIAGLRKKFEESQKKCDEFEGKMINLRGEYETLEKKNFEQIVKHIELQDKFDEMNKSYQELRNNEPSLRKQIIQLKQKFSAEVQKDEEDQKQLKVFQKEWTYMGMSESLLHDKLNALPSEILANHWSFLETKESTEKLNKRNQLEGISIKLKGLVLYLLYNAVHLQEFLWIVPHDRKFFLPETSLVLRKSVCEMEDFNASKAVQGFKYISQYANNLLNNPWRKEYRLLKLYSGVFQHEIRSNLFDGEKLFEAMGYRKLPNETMVFDYPISPEDVALIAREAMLAHVECQIMQDVYIGLSKMGVKCSWRDIFHYRERHVGGTVQTIVGLLNAEQNFRYLGYESI